jgi:hypothetical protein
MIINGNKLPEKATVLGEVYKFFYETEECDPKMKGNDGYTETEEKEIHIEKGIFEDQPEDKQLVKNLPKYGRKVIRHELVHAFIEESGLAECNDWARSEELVDWIAKQFPKMMKCFVEAGVAE